MEKVARNVVSLGSDWLQVHPPPCFQATFIECLLKVGTQGFPGGLAVKDSALPLLWLRFDPWCSNSHMLQARQKKKEEEEEGWALSTLLDVGLQRFDKVYTNNVQCYKATIPCYKATKCIPRRCRILRKKKFSRSWRWAFKTEYYGHKCHNFRN